MAKTTSKVIKYKTIYCLCRQVFYYGKLINEDLISNRRDTVFLNLRSKTSLSEKKLTKYETLSSYVLAPKYKAMYSSTARLRSSCESLAKFGCTKPAIAGLPNAVHAS